MPQLIEYFDYLIQLFGEAIFNKELEKDLKENYMKDDYIEIYKQSVLMLLTLVEGYPDK